MAQTLYVEGTGLVTMDATEAAERDARCSPSASWRTEELRIERDRKLVETDYWALSDTTAMTQAQTDYRQALRDITDNYTSLSDVVWPTKP
jgi:hypothetical protein